MSKYDELRLQYDQIAQNKAKRLVLCICVDASASMTLQQRMSTVNREIGTFLQNMYNNATARDAVEVCIIAFGDQIKVMCDFGSLTEAIRANRDIKATGARTELGAGVLKALDRLDNRLQLLTDLGAPFYKPWLILISDGEATDAARCKEAAKKVRERLSRQQLKVKCLSLGDEGNAGAQRTLREFTLDGEVDRVNSLEMTEFFEMLSRSVSRASQQSIQTGEFELDNNYRHN